MSPTPPSSRASQCWGPKQITQSQNLSPSGHVPMKMTADTPRRNRPVPTRHIRSHTARWVPGCWDSGLRGAGLHAQGHTEVDTGLRLETQVSGHYGRKPLHHRSRAGPRAKCFLCTTSANPYTMRRHAQLSPGLGSHGDSLWDTPQSRAPKFTARTAVWLLPAVHVILTPDAPVPAAGTPEHSGNSNGEGYGGAQHIPPPEQTSSEPAWPTPQAPTAAQEHSLLPGMGEEAERALDHIPG